MIRGGPPNPKCKSRPLVEAFAELEEKTKMKKNKFKILCNTGHDYWHCMDKTYDSIEEAIERAKKYVWGTAIVEIKEILQKEKQNVSNLNE